MSNTAKDILIPSSTSTFRITFLYVGQGDCTLLTIPDNGAFKYVLIDTNRDKEAGGIDIKKMLSDLLDDGLDVFINTHPHKDHLVGIKEIHDSTPIGEVWHSGHVPGKDHDEAYQEMKEVIKDIGDENEYFLFGTNSENKVRKSKEDSSGVTKKLGDIDYIVLSPAKYVTDDVDNEDADTRYKRIHERCGVIKYYYGDPTPVNVMVTGDSDKTAWKEHITEYHKEKLPSEVLRSSHHGSRSFFKDSKDDEDVYEDHIEEISPSHIVVSAPKKSESKHDHPHDDAIELYKNHLDDEDNLYHLGKNRESVIVDIYSDGTYDVKFDKDLVEKYGFGDDDGGNSGNLASGPAIIGGSTTVLDRKPSGRK